METITLIDGTVLDGRVLPNGDDRMIYVYLSGMSLMEGFAAFSDAENIAVLVVNNHGNEHTYEGFTEIVAISSEYGNCNLTLKKGNG